MFLTHNILHEFIIWPNKILYERQYIYIYELPVVGKTQATHKIIYELNKQVTCKTLHL